ncbi:DUF4145 domain-containing protein [Candidatus Falkowbacteria bacterium]|nr:DUF4145 domain-containing protein [Candidatus Falkowbacteria bacterium]
MNTKLVQLEQRINELEKLANEIVKLAKKLFDGQDVQPKLSINGQRWYRGARELLVQQDFSGLEEFDNCYEHYHMGKRGDYRSRAFSDIEQYINRGTNERNKLNPNQGDHLDLFIEFFQKARSLLLSVVDEVLSKELPVVTQLSFTVSADEFTTAEEILKSSNNEEVFIRASGVIARVALERHLHTVIDSRGLQLVLNPPNKKKPTANDLLMTLVKNNIITAIQKSELDSLFAIGNNCAHVKENVKFKDTERMIQRSKELSSIIL